MRDQTLFPDYSAHTYAFFASKYVIKFTGDVCLTI